MIYQSAASFEIHRSLQNYVQDFEKKEVKIISEKEFRDLVQLIINTMAIVTVRNESENIKGEFIKDNDYTLKTVLDVISKTLDIRIKKIITMEKYYREEEKFENEDHYHELKHKNQDLVKELILILASVLNATKLLSLSADIDKLLITERL